MTSAYENNIEYSRSLQEKYEYYLIALTFTLLALSIQTGAFSEDLVATFFELLGWASLLISGFIGLLRLEMQPVAHKNFAKLYVEKGKLSVLENQQLTGIGAVDEEVEIKKEWIDINEPNLLELEARLIKQYHWHKWLFFGGVLAIVISRAYSPLASIYSGVG